MKVNFNVPVRAFNGEEMRTNDGRGGSVPVVLSHEIQKALFMFGKDGGVSNDDKYRAYKIGSKLAVGLDDFTAEELAFIRDNIGVNFVAGVYGQICHVIEDVTNQKSNN